MVNLVIILIAKYLFLVNILIIVAYFLKAQKQMKKQLLLLAVPAFIFSYILAKFLALFIHDPRPFVTEHVKPLIPHVADNGFPSDHTLLTMTIASIVFVYNKKLGIILFIISLLIGTARVLSKIHHPFDIIGAIVIAAGATAIVYFIEKLFFHKMLKNL